jgi:putative ABC transport system permease protein
MTMLRDLILSLRSIIRRPAFLAATVLPLACGLGAAVAVFSLVHRLLLGPVGLPDADRVMALAQNLPELGGTVPMSAASLLTVTEHQRAFESVASYQVGDRTLTERGEPARITVASVTPSFFRLGQTAPVLGRLLNEEDARLGSAGSIFGDGAVAVLSDSVWRSRFGADPAVLGQGLVLEGKRYEIVGVMPPAFRYPVEAEVWVPLGFGGLASQDFGGFYFQTIARLRPGVEVKQANRELAAVAERLRPAAPSITRGLSFETETLRESLVGDRRTPLLLLFGLTLVIVLGVSANTAQILLARTLARQRDLALRLVLGASQGQVARLVLVEGLALSLLGWGLGVLLAGAVLAFFGRAVPLRDLGLDGLALNGPAVAFSLALALACGLLLGIIPSVTLRRASLQTHLREGAAQASSGPRQRSVQRLLLASQLALALVLVASGVFLFASFSRLQAVELGFDPGNVTALDLNLPAESYDPARLRTFVAQATEALRSIPGASAAGAALRLPVLDQGGGIWFNLPDRPDLGTQISATFNPVSPGFFPALRMPLLAGRDFQTHDREGGEPVAIIDEALARQFFGSQDPVGRSLVLTPWPDVRRRIVGVVPSVKFGGLRGEPSPTVYVPMDQLPFGRLRLVVRTGAQPETVLSTLRERIWEIDPGLAFDAAGVYESRISELASPDRWALRLVLALAVLGLLLSATCVYAATAHLVAQRFREWGIRLALGSSPSGIIRQVLSERLPDLAIGLVLGLAGVWLIGRWARLVLYEVSPLDPILIAASVVVLIGAALLAIWLPARRAVQTDPITILR